ncbi:hypothetical protein [Asticcacaulis solisilvae]|uniref:hypothetical protein n=1 Tax=Asticcacaulis solisilvae TaxID=1217274 RepID=UPI003FD7596D
MSVSAYEEACQWAYAKAMLLDDIRDALERFGRAVYRDPYGAVLSAQNQFVLSRVDVHGHDGNMRSIVYCNGVAVA